MYVCNVYMRVEHHNIYIYIYLYIIYIFSYGVRSRKIPNPP